MGVAALCEIGVSPASRRGQDKRGFHKRATSPYILHDYALSEHVLPHAALCCYMLHHFAICCHMLPAFSRGSSFGGIAALLPRPRLSRPRLEAGESSLALLGAARETENVIADTVRRPKRQSGERETGHSERSAEAAKRQNGRRLKRTGHPR